MSRLDDAIAAFQAEWGRAPKFGELRDYPGMSGLSVRFDDGSRPRRLCPECRDGKHRNCDGTAWDGETDSLSTCECECITS